jgi:hypothetical protein
MGISYDNLTFRGPTQEQAAAAVAAIRPHGYISPAMSGLTVAYPERLPSDLNYRNACRKLSKQLACPALAAGVFDDDVFYYALYDGGQLVDEYNSRPDYGSRSRAGCLEFVRFAFVHIVLRRPQPPRGAETVERMEPRGGNTELLCRLFGMPGDAAKVERVLAGEGRFPLENHSSEVGRHLALVKALDWPETEPSQCEELMDFHSTYQADHIDLSHGMFSHVPEGWREAGTWR